MGKIFITGCAKSGTTLIRRLFNSFDLKVYNKSEISLKSLLNSDYDIGKRTSSEIFSNVLSEQQIQKNLNLIEKNKVTIVNVVRNKFDTLKSSNGYVSE